MSNSNCECECRKVFSDYTDAEQALLNASGKDYARHKIRIYDELIHDQEKPCWERELIEAVKTWQDPKVTEPDQTYIDVAGRFFKIWEQVKGGDHEFLVAAEFHYFQSVTLPDLEGIQYERHLEEMQKSIDDILRDCLEDGEEKKHELPRNPRGWYCLGYYLIARGDHDRAELAFKLAVKCVSGGNCPLYKIELAGNEFLFDANDCKHGFSTCPTRGAWAGLSYLDSDKAVYETDMDKKRLLLTKAYARLKGFIQAESQEESESELWGGDDQ